jgi:hypothetical protein
MQLVLLLFQKSLCDKIPYYYEVVLTMVNKLWFEKLQEANSLVIKVEVVFVVIKHLN